MEDLSLKSLLAVGAVVDKRPLRAPSLAPATSGTGLGAAKQSNVIAAHGGENPRPALDI